MNETGQPAEGGSTAHDAQLETAAALGLLPSDQWVIAPVPGAGTTCIREWSDGSVDTVFVRAEATYGRRDNAAEKLVWRFDGSVDEVVRAVLDLEPPGSPGAPSDPIPDPTERKDRSV